MVTSSVCKVTAIGGLTLEMVTGGPALLLPLSLILAILTPVHRYIQVTHSFATPFLLTLSKLKTA